METKIARVAGAMLMPMNELPGRVGELQAKEAIAILCHTGVRSASVADWLLQHGFETVANVVGGIEAWSLEIDSSIPRY